MPTAKQIRDGIVAAGAKWTVDDRLQDLDTVTTHALGGELSQAQHAADVPRIDITPHISGLTSNPFLLKRRIDIGLIKQESLPAESVNRLMSLNVATDSASAAAPAAGTTAASVDWRNRFGWTWLTEVKDQGRCGACWVFSAVGVVEAMARIEHTIWSLRSEGDVHDGLGAKCAQGGWPNTALDWIKKNGVADPGCWAYEQNDTPYAPTPDRDGRTIKLADYVTLSNVQDQKNWLDNIGPISACFECYDDFFGYGPNSNVYTQTSNTLAGGHCIVIVGYDDTKNAWLIRNSWGTGWGMEGYCWFGYGQCNIDGFAKYGVSNTNINPDPWTKRRVHNGNLIESGDGALNRNFEVWVQGPGHAVRHYWRDGTSFAWALADSQGSDCLLSPTATSTTYNRNFEYVYPTVDNRLHHWFYDQASSKWTDGGVFGPSNVGGMPGFIQSDYGAPGNFEVVVRLNDDTLKHWWRSDGLDGKFVWSEGVGFAAAVAFSGATLIQLRPEMGRGLDLVCVNNDGTMQRWRRDDAHGMVWGAAEKFAAAIKSSPVMIEGQYDAMDETKQGNYELCVVVNGAIQHWWRDNQGSGAWANSSTFGSNIAQVLGLIESSYGFDLEVIAQLTNGGVQHFWRGGGTWFPGPVFGSTAV